MTGQGGKTLRRSRPRGVKLWLDVMMVFFLVILAVALYLVAPQQTQLAPIFDDLELLSTVGGLDFYLELEFYYWLEQQHGQD